MKSKREGGKGWERKTLNAIKRFLENEVYATTLIIIFNTVQSDDIKLSFNEPDFLIAS